MLIHLEGNIEFVFDDKFIHHIEKQEGMNDNMVLVLSDGTNRVITKTQYSKLIDELEIMYL